MNISNQFYNQKLQFNKQKFGNFVIFLEKLFATDLNPQNFPTEKLIIIKSCTNAVNKLATV